MFRAVREASRGLDFRAGIQVSAASAPAARLLSEFCFSGSYNPFDGPNENPEAELPLTAGRYLYVYGDMDEDGFYEGLLKVAASVRTAVPAPGCPGRA